MLPHQRRERLPERAHAPAAPSEQTRPGPDDRYWSWREIPGRQDGHTMSWRPRLFGITDPTERITTIHDGLRGTMESVSSLESWEARKTGNRTKRECLREAGAAMSGIPAAREVRGYSPPRLEIRCRVCEAGIVIPTPAPSKMEGRIREAVGILIVHWERRECRAVKRILTARVVMET